MAIPVSNAFSAYANAAKSLNLNSVASPPPSSIGSIGSAPNTGGMSFAQMLEDVGNSAMNQGRAAEGISANALQGKSNIGDVVAAVSNAEVTLQTVLSVRDRVVSGIQEIMRMPV